MVGAGNAMQFTTGNKLMGKVQMKWNWRVGMKSIRYGCKWNFSFSVFSVSVFLFFCVVV